MFKDQLKLNNSKLLNLYDKVMNKDEILNQLRIRLYASIAILSIICIASIVCIMIRSELMIPIFITSVSIYLIASIILIKSRLIDVEHVALIGMIYILVYLGVSSLLIGCNNPLI